jgi:lipopolysaccharide/colanic/teichoic acid biosynthesis glycosyltransferase
MPALIQIPDSKPSTIAAYGEFVSYWLSDLGSSHERGRAKRAIDVVVAALLILLFAPTLALLVGLVWLAGGSPLYGHERIGRGGRTFLCWKIRTMVPDAARRLDEVLRADPELAAEWARDHKLRRDPRVTRVGRVLRWTKLDELPQLWNVLVGDMSLVGPRPVTAEELAKYGRSLRHYLAVRPGLTGVWQLDGRNDPSYDRRVLLDRYYVMRPSVLRDVGLLVRTPVAIVRRGGC